jgi:hypothetical protein
MTCTGHLYFYLLFFIVLLLVEITWFVRNVCRTVQPHRTAAVISERQCDEGKEGSVAWGLVSLTFPLTNTSVGLCGHESNLYVESNCLIISSDVKYSLLFSGTLNKRYSNCFRVFCLFSDNGGDVLILHCSEKSERFVKKLSHNAIKHVGRVWHAIKFTSTHRAAVSALLKNSCNRYN